MCEKVDMDNKERYNKLKSDVEAIKTTQERAKWNYDESLKRLQEAYGCKNLAEAKDKYANLEAKLKSTQDKLTQMVNELERDVDAIRNETNA